MSGDDKIRRNMPGMQDHDEVGMDDLDASEEFFEDDSYAEGDEDGEIEPGEDEWESYDGELPSGDGTAAVPKKKMPKSNMIIIGGAVVVGLGIMLMTLSNHKPASKAVNGVNTGALPGVVESPKFSSSTKAVVAAKPNEGLLNDPSALNNLTKKIDTAAQTPANPVGSTVPALDPNAAPTVGAPPTAGAPEVAVAPPMPAPIGQSAASAPAQAAPPDILTPMPSPPPAAAPEPAIPPAPGLAAQPEPVPAGAGPVPGAMVSAVPAPPSAAVPPAASSNPIVSPPPLASAADPEMEAKLSQLLDRMSAVEAKLADAGKQPASADIATVQQTLAQINSRLDRLENRAPAAVAAPVAHAARVRTHASHVAAPHTTAPRREINVETSAARWVLKSAQPGQAYVSRPGQADMISVHVGDTLPGVGQITAIGEEGGRWVVHGTQSAITQ